MSLKNKLNLSITVVGTAENGSKNTQKLNYFLSCTVPVCEQTGTLELEKLVFPTVQTSVKIFITFILTF